MAKRGKRIFELGDYWLSQRPGSKKYYLTWYEAGTRHISRETTDTDDLEQAKRILIERVQRASRPSRTAPEDVLLNEVMNGYLVNHLAIGPSYDTGCQAVKFFDAFFARHDLATVADLRPFHMDWFIKERRKDGAKDDTISRNLGVLRASLNYARKQGLLDDAPYIKGLPKGPPRERWLTPEEARRLMDATPSDHIKDYILLSLHTLARPRAIFDLTVYQVNLERRIIDFLPPGQRQSNKRRPVVPISNALMPMLKRRIEESESGYIIEYEGRPILGNLRIGFRRAAERAGLGRDVIPYTLRHTGATWLAMQGVPMREIAGMMGHSVLRTTEMYAKHHPDFMRGAANALDAVFPGGEALETGEFQAVRATGPIEPYWIRANLLIRLPKIGAGDGFRTHDLNLGKAVEIT
mgnify:CR=1 FL=1